VTNIFLVHIILSSKGGQISIFFSSGQVFYLPSF